MYKRQTEYTADFEMFWALYPDRWDRANSHRIKRKKEPAFEKWILLSNEIRAECLLGASKIKSFEGSSARDCVTWINQKGWLDMRPKKRRPLPQEIQDMAAGLLKSVPKEESMAVKANRQVRALMKAQRKET